MKNFKITAAIILFLLPLLSMAQEQEDKSRELPGNWFVNNANIVWGDKTRYGPIKTSQLYLEYELMGRQGPFDFYGYVDFPKTFGVGSDHLNGIWDKEGSKAFADLQGRMSINHLFKMGTTPGPLKEFFVASTYIGDYGKREYGSASHVLWIGAGTTINTYSKFALDVNFYFRKNFSNYMSPQEYRWKGYKVKLNWSYPLKSMMNGDLNLNYIGFSDIDFGTGKAPKETPSESIGSNDSFVISNVLDISYKRWHCAGVLRYWHHGGEMKNNGGSFRVQTNGFGYYIVTGFRL